MQAVLRLYFILILSGLDVQSAQAQLFEDWKSLVGYWEFQTAEGVFSEEWNLLNDSTYVGIGMLKSQTGDTLFAEDLRVIKTGEEVYYVARIDSKNDGKEVLFRLEKNDDFQWYFTNPNHDFPKVISYTLRSPEYLYVWVEGKIGGNTTRKYFHFNRRAISKMDKSN